MTRRTPDPEGTLIPMSWGDEDPIAWYVRGHVPEAQAVATVQAELEDEVEDGQRERVPRLQLGGHGYARWGMGVDDDGRRVSHRFYAPAKPGPGAFKVTEVVDLDNLEFVRWARQAERDHAADLEAWTLACFPQATDIQAHGYPPGQGNVRFRLPGLTHQVFREPGRNTVSISQDDAETWARLYSIEVAGNRPSFTDFTTSTGRTPRPRPNDNTQPPKDTP